MNKFYTSINLYGNSVLIRGYENGKKIRGREEFYPTLFVPSKKPSEWKTLEGENVQPVQPGTIKECREFFSKYEEVENFEVYGNERYVFQYISDNYPGQIKFDTSLMDIVSLDIEVESEQGFPDPTDALEEVLLITIQHATTKDIITWGQTKHGEFVNKQDNVTFIPCRDEHHLLTLFTDWWYDNCPDVVTGWNIEYYDIPYLATRLERVMGPKVMKKLSPWGFITEEHNFDNRGMKKRYFNICGVTQLDYLTLYRKFTYTNQESYRLDHIASVELGQKKLDHSEFDTFKDFYRNGWQKFVEYNIVDAELVDRLEDKMKLIDLAITMAFDAKVNFQDVFYQVRLWDTIIYNYLRDRNIVIPPKQRTDKNSKFAGAYVKEPVPGVYDWVVSFDLNSLYPHLLMQYNISPETLLDERCPNVSVDKILNEEVNFEMYKDYAVCANGAMFRKDERGFLPTLMEKMYAERKQFKKQMLACKQKLVDIESEMKRRGIQ